MQPTPSLVIVTHSWAIITWNKILWRCQVKFNSHHVRTEWIFGKTPIQRKSNQSQVVARGKHGIPDTRYWFYRDHPEPVVGGNSHCSWMVWGAVKSKSFSKPFINTTKKQWLVYSATEVCQNCFSYTQLRTSILLWTSHLSSLGHCRKGLAQSKPDLCWMLGFI